MKVATNISARVKAIFVGLAAVLAFTAMTCACALTPVDDAYADTGQEAMYRLYNPNSGEHFYTSSTLERDSVKAAGWKYEGVGWYAPTSGDKVYRLYNPNAGEHHYTLSAAERNMLIDVGWKYEGIGWYSDANKAVPLYRQYNPNAYANNHNYTADTNERDTLLRAGWRDEKIAWYGVEHVHAYDTPVYTTVHHDAVWEIRQICNGCGADITDLDSSHEKNHIKNGEDSSWHTDSVLMTPAYDEQVVIGYECVCGDIAHEHDYSIPIYTTVHHDAVYQGYVVCRTCGAKFAYPNESEAGIAHGKQHVKNGEPYSTTSEEQIVTPAYDEQVVSGYKCACGAVLHEHDYSIPIYTTVHHDAVYKTVHWCNLCNCEMDEAHGKQHIKNGDAGYSGTVKDVLVSSAYDEQVVSGYKCACGAVK